MNIFYFRNISEIGGIETFLNEIAKKYEEKDIIVLYKEGNYKQINRLRERIRVNRYIPGKKYSCDKAFFNINIEAIEDIEAEEYGLILHGDYRNLIKSYKCNESAYPWNREGFNKIDKVYGVSKTVCEGYKELTGRDAILVYNPYTKEEPERIIHLISATRLTIDKGKERMKLLGEKLNKAGVRYEWKIFTNDVNEIENENIMYMKPRLDIKDYIADSDYLVQLSDAEGYCYSVVEALSYNVPVIVTDMPVMKEIGVKDGKNGFILDFDLSNLDIDRIKESAGKMDFKYEPLGDGWGNILAEGESTYKKEICGMYKVRAKIRFADMEENVTREIGEEFIVDAKRKEYLDGGNASGTKVIEVIEEILEESKEEKKEVIEEKVEKEEIKEEKPKKATKRTIKKKTIKK